MLQNDESTKTGLNDKYETATGKNPDVTTIQSGTRKNFFQISDRLKSILRATKISTNCLY